MSIPNTPLGDATRFANLIAALADRVDKRVTSDPNKSYTARLMAGGPLRCGKKIAEEGAELALALAAEGKKETAGEAADLIFHMLVGLRVKGVSLDKVADKLAERRGVSGIAEKASRKGLQIDLNPGEIN